MVTDSSAQVIYDQAILMVKSALHCAQLEASRSSSVVTGKYSAIPAALHYSYLLTMNDLDPNNHPKNLRSFMNPYRVIATMLYHKGYWSDEVVRTHVGKFRETVNAYSENKVRGARTLSPDELQDALKRENLFTHDVSPLIASVINALNVNGITSLTHWELLGYLLVSMQRKYQQTLEDENKKYRAKNLAVKELHALLATLVINRLVEPLHAVTVTTMLKPMHTHQLLSLPKTNEGKARVLKLLAYNVDAGSSFAYNMKDLKELVDDRNQDYLPIQLVHEMMHTKQIVELKRDNYYLSLSFDYPNTPLCSKVPQELWKQ